MSEEYMPEVGDYVTKPAGYSYYGQVVSVFNTTAGHCRCVVELIGDNGGGMLHIFSPHQLQRHVAQRMD